MSVREIDLTPAEFALTSEKMNKLNQRALKRGWTGIITVTGEAFTEETDNGVGLKRTRQMVHTVISGDAPKYDGWTFLARIEWTDNDEAVVFTAPGIEGIDRDRLAPMWCDHCGIKRYRKYTYAVRNDDGNELQVGSTCLKDFLGWNTNPVWILPPSDNDLYGESGFGHSTPVYSVETVLAASWACIQAFGYVRTTDYSGQATKYTVLAVLDPRTPAERELARKITPHIAESASMAKRIHAFLLSDEFSGFGEYVTNLKAIARSEFCQPKFVGFLASAPQAWAKAQERSLIKQREKAEITNEFLGEIKDKLELPVTLKSIRFLESDWGVTTLYTFATDDGHIVKWFSSRRVFTDRDLERPMTIKGTVKKHDEYQGTKSTVLTRVRKL